jgi:hypothetical protein
MPSSLGPSGQRTTRMSVPLFVKPRPTESGYLTLGRSITFATTMTKLRQSGERSSVNRYGRVVVNYERYLILFLIRGLKAIPRFCFFQPAGFESVSVLRGGMKGWNQMKCEAGKEGRQSYGLS